MYSEILILPGDPEFDILAATPPPDLKGNDETNLSYVIGHDGIPRAVSSQRELDEYLLGGEYEEVIESYDDDEYLEALGLEL
jgi:hypothetical protein